MKKIVKNILYITIPLVAMNFWLFRYDDWHSGCHIKIKPSLVEFNNLQMKQALSVLRYGMPDEYASVCDNIETIEPDLPRSGAGGGMFIAGQGNKIVVSTQHGGTSAQTASIIVHEKCHVVQQKEHRSFNEEECYREGDTVPVALIEY